MKDTIMQFRDVVEYRTVRLAPERGAAAYGIPRESRNPSLRILWVNVGGLWPANTGGRKRSFHLISELSHRHDITVLTTSHPEEDQHDLARHLPRCERVVSVPHVPVKRNGIGYLLALLRSWFTRLPVDLLKSRIPALETMVNRELASGDFDLCVADFLHAVPNVPLGGNTPVVFFAHNVEHMICKRMSARGRNLLRRAVLDLEWRKMRRYENRTCNRADLTLAVSEEDRCLLSEGAPASKIAAIPTGVDLDYFRVGDRALEHSSEIVFCGSMDSHPNEDAVLYFIDAILPLLRREMPQVSMTVAGRRPSSHLQKVARAAGVRVTGTVADVRPFIRRAAVCVVPLRIGGGTRLKIYEALAMGKAVVSTTFGAEGLPLVQGIHILRADDPGTFAEQVLWLLRSRTQRQDLGNAGRSLMEQNYSWSRVAQEFERHCQALVK